MAVTDSKGSTHDIEIKAGKKGAESSLVSCGMLRQLHTWCFDCNTFQEDARSGSVTQQKLIMHLE